MKLTRRTFVSRIASATPLFLSGRTLADAATVQSSRRSLPSSRPNMIFILADDLGWGDLSCYGRPDYRTPNLDRLAAEGTKFTDAYAASAICTPTRCGFITG